MFIFLDVCLIYLISGYIVEGGVTRQPYGGHRITEALNSSFTESKYRFFTDVEFQIVRLAMEKVSFTVYDSMEIFNMSKVILNHFMLCLQSLFTMWNISWYSHNKDRYTAKTDCNGHYNQG